MEKLIVKEEVKFLNNTIFKKGDIIDKSDTYNVEIESGNIVIFYTMIENFVEPYHILPMTKKKKYGECNLM